jgi:hypothetical protein
MRRVALSRPAAICLGAPQNRGLSDLSMRLAILAATAFALAACASAPGGATPATTETTPAMTAEDPYLWLEDVEGERALTWVREQNARSLPQLENDPRYPQLLADATALANSRDRLPLGGIFEGYYYNFWQDEAHVRGIYRRARLADFARDGAPQLGVQRHRLPRRDNALPRRPFRRRQGRHHLS